MFRKRKILFQSEGRNPGRKVTGVSSGKEDPVSEVQKIKAVSSVSDLELEITWSREVISVWV